MRSPPGITALIALGILDCLQEQGILRPLSEMEHNSAEYVHALVEALRCGTLLESSLCPVIYLLFLSP